MKRLSRTLLSTTIIESRKRLNLTQKALADAVPMNRALISRLETMDYEPSFEQLGRLGDILHFDPATMFVDDRSESLQKVSPKNIVVAGTGYVGLSLAVLLAQHNHVTAVDIIPEKVDKLNAYQSPIQDEYIETYLSEAKNHKRTLNLHAVLNTQEATPSNPAYTAYQTADFVIIATPTNYDPHKNFFDTSAVESVIELVLAANAGTPENQQPIMVIKSTIPVGYTRHIREKYHTQIIIVSPEFLRD